jgi:hypothetical protein
VGREQGEERRGMKIEKMIYIAVAMFNLATAVVQLSLYVKFSTPTQEADAWRLLLGYSALIGAGVMIYIANHVS